MENNDRLKDSIKTKIAISRFRDENIAIRNKKKHVSKTIIAACFCIVLTSGIVFAKDIEKYFKILFNNSSKAIDVAVENGYVQTEDMEYIYYNDIGIKVDNLILDDLNLDISFNFEVKNANIKSIRCNDFTITSDSGKKIYDSNLQYATSLDDVYLAQNVKWSTQPKQLTNTTFSDSILFELRKIESEINELNIKITSVHLIYQDDTMEDLSGSWNFNIKIQDEMKESKKITYNLMTEDEHIESCKGTLTPTGIEVEINSKTQLEPLQYVLEHQNQNIIGPWMFYLKNNSDLVWPSDFQVGNVDATKFVIRYDEIGIFDNPDKIEIYIEPFDSTIILTKDL